LHKQQEHQRTKTEDERAYMPLKYI